MISFFVAQTRQAASGLHEMLFAGCKNMSTLVRMFGVLYRVSTSELDALSPSQKRNPIPLAENGISFLETQTPMSMQRFALAYAIYSFNTSSITFCSSFVN